VTRYPVEDGLEHVQIGHEDETLVPRWARSMQEGQREEYREAHCLSVQDRAGPTRPDRMPMDRRQAVEVDRNLERATTGADDELERLSPETAREWLDAIDFGAVQSEP
jgi:hypothetical protein